MQSLSENNQTFPKIFSDNRNIGGRSNDTHAYMGNIGRILGGGGAADSDEGGYVGTQTVSTDVSRAGVGSGNAMTEVVLLQWFTSC